MLKYRRYGACCWVLALLVGAVSAQTSEEDDDRRIRRLYDALAIDPDDRWDANGTANRAQALRLKLMLAETALNEGKLVQPPENNAVRFYTEALTIDPDNTLAEAGLDQVARRLLSQADTAAATGDRERALQLVALVEQIRPNSPALIEFRQSIDRSEEITALLETAEEHLAAGQLMEPEGANAVDAWRAVLDLDPSNAEASERLAELSTEVVVQIRSALEVDDFALAEEQIAQLERLRPDPQLVEEIGREIALAEEQGLPELYASVEAAIVAGDAEFAQELLQRIPIRPQLGRREVLEEQVVELIARSATPPGTRIRDLDGGPTMIVVPAGRFTMGASAEEDGSRAVERPRQGISFRLPFAIAEHEITVAQFRRFVDATGYRTEIERGGQSTIYDSDSGNFVERSNVSWRQNYLGEPALDDEPVIHVGWADAAAYAQWLARQTGERYRLPSEAEFAYALRAGTSTPYWWSGESPREEVENLAGDGDRYERRFSWPEPFRRYRDGYWGPAPVGSFVANGYGLSDMGGNVMEWVADCWQPSLANKAGDGSAYRDGDCEQHVIRGGSYANPPDAARSASRTAAPSSRASALLGFRVVRDL